MCQLYYDICLQAYDWPRFVEKFSLLLHLIKLLFNDIFHVLLFIIIFNMCLFYVALYTCIDVRCG